MRTSKIFRQFLDMLRKPSYVKQETLFRISVREWFSSSVADIHLNMTLLQPDRSPKLDAPNIHHVYLSPSCGPILLYGK